MDKLQPKKTLVSYRDLMQFRVYEVLVVASKYDCFKLEEDGRLTDLIFSEYQDMNLTSPPHVTKVSSAATALKKLKTERFDLVITMSRISNMDPYEFSRHVKAIRPELPVVLLVSTAKEYSYFSRLDENKDRAIDKIFLWSGDPAVLAAVIKYTEDKTNAERDILGGLVRAIIVVEDTPQYYSSFLPMIYKEITRHTYRMMNLEYSGHMRLLRMRSRPKILLATNYNEAVEYFEKYQKYVLAVISDVKYPIDGQLEPKAGIQFLKMVKEKERTIPLVLQSLDSKRKEDAKAINVRFFDKNNAHLIHDLRTFVVKHCGFDDMVFLNDDRSECLRVNNILALEKALDVVPDSSVKYHAERNHFSNWLAVRGHMKLADQIRAATNYEDIQKLRKDFKNQIRSYRKKSRATGIVDFNSEHYDPDMKFVRFGGGSLGGKARGLAFMSEFLKRYDLSTRYENAVLQVPETAIIGTDIYDEFIESNHIKAQISRELTDDEINRLFLKGSFPNALVEDIQEYLEYHKGPLAVRSSSLLEDSNFQPFAGIYNTYMIPNSSPDIKVRLKRILIAMKLVYASTFHRQSRAYMETTGNRLDDEKMGIIVQKVTGERHQNHFYPTFSGDLQTYNFYPIDKIKREDGVANIALGLGKTVASGEKSLRFCPSYPTVLLQFYNKTTVFKNSQNHFYALNMEGAEEVLKGTEEENLDKLGLKVAEEHGTLNTVASVYSPGDNTFKEPLRFPGPRIVTFANILKWNLFPLSEMLQDLIYFGRKSFGCEVEIEFAGNIPKDTSQPTTLSILQIRPLITHQEEKSIDLDQIEPEKVVFQSNICLGNGFFADSKDIIFVKPETFNSSLTEEIAREIGELNKNFSPEYGYTLMGPGRWGSSDPFLGIPVHWADISFVKSIVEVGMPEFYVDPSFGSHFFQNLTSLDISYFVTAPDKFKTDIDWEWLEQQKLVCETKFLKHIRLTDCLQIQIDGKNGMGIAVKP